LLSAARNQLQTIFCIEEIMSDSHNQHETAIKTPKQLVVAVVAGFLVPILIIVLLVKYVSSDHKVGAGSSAQTPDAIASRISPVANEGFTFIDASAPKLCNLAKQSITQLVPLATPLVQLARRNSVMLVLGVHALHKVTTQS
jgi:hypothetical protein